MILANSSTKKMILANVFTKLTLTVTYWDVAKFIHDYFYVFAISNT